MNETTQNRMNTICDMILTLSPESQNSFFETLKTTLTAKEIESLQIAVAYRSMMKDPRKYEAIKKAVGEKLFEGFSKNK